MKVKKNAGRSGSDLFADRGRRSCRQSCGQPVCRGHQGASGADAGSGLQHRYPRCDGQGRSRVRCRSGNTGRHQPRTCLIDPPTAGLGAGFGQFRRRGDPGASGALAKFPGCWREIGRASGGCRSDAGCGGRWPAGCGWRHGEAGACLRGLSRRLSRGEELARISTLSINPKPLWNFPSTNSLE